MRRLDYRFRTKNPQTTDELNARPDQYIGLFLESTSRKTCAWHTALTTLADTTHSVRDYYRNVKERFFKREIDSNTLSRSLQPVAPTARVCPAINHVLDNSWLVKTPTEIHISIDSSGEFLVNTASTQLINIMSHPARQYHAEGVELFRNRVNLKFELPILLNSHGDSYIFLQPDYHTDAAWRIPAGVIWGRETVSQQLNVNTFWEIPESGQRDYVIKAGTPLCYIWFDQPHRLRWSDRIQTVDVQQRFLGVDKYFYRDWK